MLEYNLIIEPFIPNQVGDRDWKAFNRLLNLLQIEALPDDPPVPVEQTRLGWSNIPTVVKRLTWIVREEDRAQMIAYAYCDIMQTEENQHMSVNHIAVLPEMRCMGIGTRLLNILALTTQEHNRRLMFFQAEDSIPAGLEFARRIGATVGLGTRVSQLRVADIDRQMLADWQTRAAQRASGFELGLWGLPYPEQELLAVAAIKQAMNQAPTGELDVEDVQYSPAFLRQIDASFIRRGAERWTLFAREKSTGNLAGYSEVLWMPSKPGIGLQGDTAVLEDYRNLGLGRWLKAVMLEKILRERPDTKFIRTSNADSNAPMLKINQELGFQLYQSTSICQVDTARVKEYLAEKGMPLDSEDGTSRGQYEPES